MQRENLRTILFSLMIVMMSTGMLFAQNGGGNNGGNHNGGHDGPGGGNWGHGDSTGHGDHDGNWGHGDSTGHGDHGGNWGHGDSTGHGDHDGNRGHGDSTGHGNHDGHWGHGDRPGHGGHWGNGGSLSLDSIFVSGLVSTSFDTIVFQGGHHFPGAPDSGEYVHTSYFLDTDANDNPDYQLMHLRWMSRMDSTFILPQAGDAVEIAGLLVPVEENLARILVLEISINDDAEAFGVLATADPAQLTKSHTLQSVSYPNPFNPSATIEFTLAEANQVSLRVYDIRGAEVAVLADSQFGGGVHKLNFNPENLSAGTYLYVLEAGSQREVRRIAYLK